MNHEPKPLKFEKFEATSFLLGNYQVQQIEYLRLYLAGSGLGAKRIIEEPYYFDKDYLKEFSHFYSTSTQDYLNTCRRIHIFDSDKITEKLFDQALGNNKGARTILQKSYLGFVVIRPLEHAPLGRTVLKWYPDKYPNIKRVTKTSRRYKIHLGGIKLTVDGLAWQQQDEGVSACATIALWTMLHASALDELHQIPTTAEITVSAHDNYSEGRHAFPSNGLTKNQICDSIIHYGLRPAVFAGDRIDEVHDDLNYQHPFSKRLFSHVCGSFLRAGYPLLLIGKQHRKVGEKIHKFDHTLCIVGFRESVQQKKKSNQILHFDENIQHVYIHDDNLGPNVKFEIKVDEMDRTYLTPCAPTYAASPELFKEFTKFYPIHVVAALNSTLRSSPNNTYFKAYDIADKVFEIWRKSLKQKENVTFGIQFFKTTEYLEDELSNLLESNKVLLTKVRKALMNDVSPISLHIAVIRIGIDGLRVFDVICDTSQSSPVPYATICFHSDFKDIIETLETTLNELFGTIIEIYLDK